jgi:branched-chain amino acid transport system permease protein
MCLNRYESRKQGAEIMSITTGENSLSQIGTDEWVAQVDARQRRSGGVRGRLGRGWTRVPTTWRYGLALALLLLLPWITGTAPVLNVLGFTNNEFMVRIGAQFLLFALLAIGLNIVVGYAGLLDLGYIAFFGIAGYAYAYLSSDFVTMGGINGLHLPSLVSIPLIIAFTTLIGWLLGLLSLRLAGDYLAIVTLGFGQIFVLLALTATRVQLPWRAEPVDLTRGPNGINGLDDLTLFGFTLQTTTHYYYLFVVLLVLVYTLVHRLNHSHLGRGWRALKDDELAAAAMGLPTLRLKLLAFALGAAIAALAGSVDAAWAGSVVPVPRYSTLTLINLYAMMVLGGVGSLPGVVLGALIFTVLPEILRSPPLASLLFYSALLIGLVVWLRSLKRVAGVLGSTLAAGALLKASVLLLWPDLHAGLSPAGVGASAMLHAWLVIPTNAKAAGNAAIIAALCALFATLSLTGRWRWLLLGITLYLAVFAWETRLALEPAATRILIVGATLVTLMIARPQGLLGKPEVRVV